MEIQSKLKKQIIKRHTQGDGHPSDDIDQFEENYSFLVQPISTQDVRLSSSLRNELRRPGDTIQQLLYELVDIHNCYYVGELLYDAIVDAVHIDEIVEYKAKTFVAAKQAAKWYLSRRKGKYTPILEISNFFNNIITPLIQFVTNKQSAIGTLFSPFLNCLVREYYRLITLEMTGWHTSDGFSPDYKDVPELMHSFLDMVDSVFTLTDYVNTTRYSKRVASSLKSGDILSKDRKAEMLYDIGEMIPILMRNWDPVKHPIPISNDFSAYIEISQSYPEVIFAKPGSSPLEVRNSSYKIAWNFCNHDMCWLLDQWTDFPDTDKIEAFFLPRLHDYLLQIFSKVVLREKPTEVTSQEEYFESTLQLHLKHSPGLSSEVLEEFKDSSAETIDVTVSQLRWNRFEKHMMNQFGCSFDGGKGSEIKIQRPGSKIYTVGHHKKNPLVSSWMIKKILKRLDISNIAWAESLAYL